MNNQKKYSKYRSKSLDKYMYNKKYENLCSDAKNNETDNRYSKEIIFVSHGETTENIAIKNGDSYDEFNVELTKNGELQATETGKYLNMFNEFDKVFSSPEITCIQTCEFIFKEILSHENIKNNLLRDQRLIEMGHNYNGFNGLSKHERNKILGKNQYLAMLYKKNEETKNPYDKIETTRKLWNAYSEFLEIDPTIYQVENNIKSFLNDLKMVEGHRILVVVHKGTMEIIQNIICNIDFMSYISNKKCLDNCCIMCTYLDKNNNYNIIKNANTDHLNKI